MTDVRLDEGSDGSFLVLEGRVVKAAASDFMLDFPSRRSGPKPFRRALVHDAGDGLTINFANDYKGGVTLNGVREILPQGDAALGKIAQKVDQTPTLVVRGDIQFEAHSRGLLVAGGDHGGVQVTTLSLHGELVKLQTQISALQAKVTELETHK